MRLVRPGRAFEIAQVDGTNVRDWRRHGFLHGVGVLNGQWQYDFRDIVVLRLMGILAILGLGPTSAVRVARKAAAKNPASEWLFIGPHERLLFSDDFDALVEERRRRRWLAAFHIPLGDVVRDVHKVMNGDERSLTQAPDKPKRKARRKVKR